jgi:predicted neuraminidase
VGLTTAGRWSNGVRWLWAAIVTGIFLWAARHALQATSEDSGGFVVATIAKTTAGPQFESEFIVRGDAGGRTEHVASICELSDGRLVAVWYSGSSEGSSDVALMLASKAPDAGAAWSTPRPVVTPTEAARELGRPVGKVGNAVVFTDGSYRLFLVFVTLPFGGWALSALNVKVSTDGGASWSPARRLHAAPIFDFGTLVKNKPLPLRGGEWLLPASSELLGRMPTLLRLTVREGKMNIVGAERLCGGRRFLQPALVGLGPITALALLRAARAGEAIGLSRTADGGVRWSEPVPTGLANPDAGIDALALTGRRVLLAFNDERFGRSELAFALSDDAGASWKKVATLDEEPGAEFSYPFMIRAHDGSIHLVYTWKRSNIRHVRCNETWIEDELRRAP